MGSSLSCIASPGILLVADTSTVINLNATGCANSIVAALPNRIAVVDVVPGELAAGRSRGRNDATLFDDLLATGLIDVVVLNEAATQHFEELVIGPAASTLDDGEAATIAYAVTANAAAILDEKKATRISSERFPALSVGCTVDLFKHPAVEQAIGAQGLAEAVFNALIKGRMRVVPHHIEWVLKTIGPDRASLCNSLPHAVRGRAIRKVSKG